VARLQRSASLIRAAAQHAERVYSVVAEEAAPVPEIEELSSSWQRSTNRYGVDSLDSRSPRILTPGELKDVREPLGNLISTA
jgi:transcriptional regulator of acetoin/glycerol metabolism